MDKEEKKKEKKKEETTNVQPALLIKLMMESEPCLFNNKSEPAVVPTQMPAEWASLMGIYHQTAKWHGALQAKFERETFGYTLHEYCFGMPLITNA